MDISDESAAGHFAPPALPSRSTFWRVTGLVLATVVHGGVMLVATLWVLIGTQGLCGEPAGWGSLHDARVQLSIVLALSLLPWIAGFVTACVRRRDPGGLVGIAIAGLVVSGFPAYWLVSALQATPAEWSIDWCLF